MKHIFLTTVAILLANLLFGQVPQAFNYQGAARTAAGAPIANSTIAIRASVLDGSAAGTVVYSERNVTTTSGSGIFSIGIGNGTPITGTFGAIDWASGNKFLKIDLDATGGTNYVTLGTTQFLSVPYAQYAGSAGQISVANKTITGIIKAIDENGDLLTDASGFAIDLLGHEPVLSTITDATGSFKFSNVAPGEYMYSIAKNGYKADMSNGFSLVNGGFKQVVRDPVFKLTSNSSVIESSSVRVQNLSVTTTSSNGTEYNSLTFQFGLSSPKNPLPYILPALFYSTVAGFQVNDMSNPIGQYNGNPNGPEIYYFLYDSYLNSGTRVYFKVFNRRFDGKINFDNGSNEVSVIVPPKSSIKVQNLTATTTTSEIDGSNSIVFSGIVNGVADASASTIFINIFYSTSPGVSTGNNNFSADIIDGHNVNFNYLVSQGLFASGSRVYFKAYHSFNDGSGINQTSASNEVSIVIPSISSVNLSGFAVSTATSLGNGENYLTFSGNISAPQTNGVRIYYGSTSNFTPSGSNYIETSNNSGNFSVNQVVNGSNLTPGATVYFKVFSIDPNGNTDFNSGSNVIAKIIPPTNSIVEGMNYMDGILVHLFKPGEAGYVAGEVHGLLAMNTFINFNIQFGWSPTSMLIAGLGNGIGEGLNNTNTIIAAYPGQVGFAAEETRFAYGNGSVPNVFLPSRDELLKLFTLRSDLLDNGNMPPDGFYWTSSQASEAEAYIIYNSGEIGEMSKDTPHQGAGFPFRTF